MTMILLIAAFVSGVAVANLIEKAFASDWLYHHEYERFLDTLGSWKDEAVWAVP